MLPVQLLFPLLSFYNIKILETESKQKAGRRDWKKTVNRQIPSGKTREKQALGEIENP